MIYLYCSKENEGQSRLAAVFLVTNSHSLIFPSLSARDYDDEGDDDDKSDDEGDDESDGSDDDKIIMSMITGDRKSAFRYTRLCTKSSARLSYRLTPTLGSIYHIHDTYRCKCTSPATHPVTQQGKSEAGT